MGTDLRNSSSGDSFHFNLYGWENVLALAEMYGWHPAGTRPPGSDEQDAGQEAWEGEYFANDGQTVTAEDARDVADALEEALDDIPSHNAAAHKTKRTRTKSGFVETVPPGAKISPLEALSGSNKRFVVGFIAFCRRGSFEIW